MGWWLTRSGGKNRRRRPTRRLYEGVWDPQRTLTGLKWLGAAAAIVGTVFGWRFLETALHEYVSQTRAAAVSRADVLLDDAPSWMSDAVRLRLRRTVAEHVGADPLDPTGLVSAAKALSRDPWVQQVEQVFRRGDGAVAVRARYREPIALVESEQGYRLVDGQGVVLPGIYEPQQARAMALPLITGVSTSAPEPGRGWPGEDLRAGLSLVRFLADEPYAEQIESYDVGHRDNFGRVRLVLYTDRGMVRWGLAPGREQGLEPAASSKRRWLRQVAAAHGGAIDAGGRVVDVYAEAVTTSYPGTDASAAGR